MLEYLKQESDLTYTENGAVTLTTTGSECLDLFATIGALRKASEEEITVRFSRAFSENASLAMKLLFFARDVRVGLGERRVFRVIVNWLSVHEPEVLKKNIKYMAEFGRFDDLVELIGTSCEKEAIHHLKNQYKEDMAAMKQEKPVSLLAKWLPSINTSNQEQVEKAKRIARSFGLRHEVYRKQLAELRKYIQIIENNLREKDYTFDYAKQPSRALYKYRAAFLRNDGDLYCEFLNRVTSGKAVLHADQVAPYELIDPYLNDDWFGNDRCFMKSISEDEKAVLNATWNSLPDFGGNENALVVVDTSGSMYSWSNPTPASVAISLGLYFAERNKGKFHNHFIEFSEEPRLIEIKGETFVDRLRYVTSFNEVADTNLEAVFDLVLNTALKHQLKQEELPAKLIVVTDMEFNRCVENASLSNFEQAKHKIETNGYKLPDVVFWNVASRNRQQPVTQNEQGVALISGVAPRLFSMIAGGNLSPYNFMMEVLNSERYAMIAA